MGQEDKNGGFVVLLTVWRVGVQIMTLNGKSQLTMKKYIRRSFLVILIFSAVTSLSLADEYIQKYPGTKLAADLQNRKAELLLNLKNYDLAIDQYQVLLQNYTDSEPARAGWYWIGECYLKMNDPVQAQDAYARQVTNFPQSSFSPEAYLKMGEIYQDKKDYKKAIENYQDMLKIYPDTDAAGRAMLSIGRCYKLTGQSRAAQTTFQKVFDQFADTEIAHRAQLELGKIYLTNAQYERAISELQSVVDYHSADLSAEAQYWLGETYFNEGDYSRAAIEYLKVKYLFPGVEKWIVQGIYQAALANENQQRFGEARLLYRTIIEQFQDEAYQQKAQKKLQEIAGK